MNRRDFLAAAATASLTALVPRLPAQTARPRPNVLFIAVDDLRPELNCYGRTHIVSPNLDALAATGLMFTHAYCQQAVCSPSRTSLLTGLRPDSTRVYDLETHFRKNVPEVTTLPEHFKNQGYFVTGIGKLFHGGLNDEQSWSEPYLRIDGGKGYVEEDNLAFVRQRQEAIRQAPAAGRSRMRAYSFPFEAGDVPDNAYNDGRMTEIAETTLERLTGQDQPFFFAVGYLKPHLPFNCPKRFWDLYDPASISMADNPFAPEGAPPIALHTSGELRAYREVPPGSAPIPDDLARKLIHGYYACVSYTDHNIGRLLKKLAELGRDRDTLVVVWGDHGWHLGDHGLWCKHTNFETATRVPMFLRVPGAASAGTPCHALTEFVDIYPTLCELAGLPLPPHLEGTSFAPLVENPQRPWKRAAFSQYPRGGDVMGYSMRTERHRYTEWIRRSGTTEAIELYDHETDPQENTNLAVRPEHAELVARLGTLLHEGWRAARPPA
ncbi:MAG: sulfatase [Lentisphaeria bacterium]|jgi:arylsulfatase A-like enzyme|nr:sulfatase [Lentisphaeria bacterium]